MDFKEQYKQCAEIMDPSAEAMERMKRNILAQTAVETKKAFPFRKIAYVGGALAACMVVVVAAATILPRTENAGIADAESCTAGAAMEMADQASGIACDGAVGGSVGSYAEQSVTRPAATTAVFDGGMSYSEAEGADCAAEAADSDAVDFQPVNGEADIAEENGAFADSSDDIDYTLDGLTPSSAASRELIVFQDGISAFSVDGREYIAIAEDIAAGLEYPEAFTTIFAADADDELYYICDYVDFIELLRESDGQCIGLYCAAESYDEFVGRSASE